MILSSNLGNWMNTQEALITQISPGGYLYEIPEFNSSFINYLSLLGEKKLFKRSKAFKRGLSFRIHIEKMKGLEYELDKMNLARKDSYPWWIVEQETAKEFMAYLAATLGKLDDLNFSPVSDDIIHLQHFEFLHMSQHHLQLLMLLNL